MKSGFKTTINWNKCQSKETIKRQNQYLHYLIDPRFQRVNTRFILSFEFNEHRISYKRLFLPAVEIKEYNVMIDEQNIFLEPVKNNLRTYDNIQKIAADEDAGCLLDHPYFKENCKIIA